MKLAQYRSYYKELTLSEVELILEKAEDAIEKGVIKGKHADKVGTWIDIVDDAIENGRNYLLMANVVRKTLEQYEKKV